MKQIGNYFQTIILEDPVDDTHVVLVRDAQFARHAKHSVPEHRVNGEGGARGLGQGTLGVKQQVLDIRAGASLKQSKELSEGI